jgi:hypothetical protein
MKIKQDWRLVKSATACTQGRGALPWAWAFEWSRILVNSELQLERPSTATRVLITVTGSKCVWAWPAPHPLFSQMTGFDDVAAASTTQFGIGSQKLAHVPVDFGDCLLH